MRARSERALSLDALRTDAGMFPNVFDTLHKLPLMPLSKENKQQIEDGATHKLGSGGHEPHGNHESNHTSPNVRLRLGLHQLAFALA